MANKSVTAHGVLVVASFVMTITLLSGCFYVGREGFEDVVRRSPSEWSSRDCLTVILSAMMHNLNDNAKNVECIATPFYPSVVVALNQIRRTQYHWSEDDAQLHMDELLKGSSGLYVDWHDGRFVNAQGNYFRNQTDIDSLLIVVSLKNKTYPCAVPHAALEVGEQHAMAPLLHMADWPCYLPNIVDIESRVCLVNEQGDTLRPKYVWGRRHETLTSPETFFVMFPLRATISHFLEHSSRCSFDISGFDTKIELDMDVSHMR